MDNIIDIYDVNTYSKELLKFLNSIKDKSVYKEYVEEFCSIIKEYYFKVVHVTVTMNIENFKKYGIQRPFVVNSSNEYHINKKAKQIILEPIKTYFSKEEYIQSCNKYDAKLINEFNESLIYEVPNWFGKYSHVCYSFSTFENLIDNSIYEFNYGGELLQEEVGQELKRYAKEYAIFFKIKGSEILNDPNIMPDDLVTFMISYLDEKNTDIQFEGSVNKDINVEDFLEIKEIL